MEQLRGVSFGSITFYRLHSRREAETFIFITCGHTVVIANSNEDPSFIGCRRGMALEC